MFWKRIVSNSFYSISYFLCSMKYFLTSFEIFSACNLGIYKYVIICVVNYIASGNYKLDYHWWNSMWVKPNKNT